jgi:two-component system sensor histidine kinase TctE
MQTASTSKAGAAINSGEAGSEIGATPRRAGTSLRRSLLRALVLPIAAALLTGGVFGYRAAEKVVSSAYDQSLSNLANGIANRARVENGEVTIALSSEAEALLRTDTVDDIYFRVRDDFGRIIAGDVDLPPPETSESGAAAGSPTPFLETPTSAGATATGSRISFFDAQFRDQTIRGVRFHPVVDGQGIYVTVAETLGKRRAAIRDLLLGFGLAVFLVLAAIAAVVRYGITSGLASLHHLQSELAERSGEDLAPVDLNQVPLEIHALVRALNALLTRLQDAHTAQREFLQDAAHQLRTPPRRSASPDRAAAQPAERPDGRRESAPVGETRHSPGQSVTGAGPRRGSALSDGERIVG